jgi:hypothetical protein
LHLPAIRIAAEAIATLGAADPEAEMIVAWNAAHAIVTAEWPTLLRVAEVLQSRLSLTGAEFEAEWRGRGLRSLAVVL